MLDTGNTCDVLLRDVIHMRPDGPAFGYYSNFIAEELVRIPEANGDPKFSGTITEIPVTDSPNSATSRHSTAPHAISTIRCLACP